MMKASKCDLRHLLALAAIVAAGGCGQETDQRAGAETASQDATVVYPGDILSDAPLGEARDLVKEAVLPAQCVSSPYIVTSGGASSYLRVDGDMSYDEASRFLGFEGTGKARFGLANTRTVTAKAEFARSTVSKELSISLYYLADYYFETEEMNQTTLSWAVDPAQTKPAYWLARGQGLRAANRLAELAQKRWIELCGDEFNWRRIPGGQIWFLYRIDFDSKETKSQFEAELSNQSRRIIDINASVSGMSETYKSRASVHVEAYQLGGNVTLLPTIATCATETGHTVCNCSMENLADCGTLMQNGYVYMTDPVYGFSAQLNDPNLRADREYAFESWVLLPGGPQIPLRAVPPQLSTLRFDLITLFDYQVAVAERIDSLSTSYFTTSQYLRDKLPSYKTVSDNNIRLLEEAEKVCWDDITDPTDSRQIRKCAIASNLEFLKKAGFDEQLTLDKLQDIQFKEIATPMVTYNQVTITWKTDRPTTSVVRYRVLPNGGWSYSPDDGQLVTDHSVTIGPVFPLMSYEYVVQGVDGFDFYGLAGESRPQSVLTAKGTYDVGIIPNGTCMGDSPWLEIQSDDEDHDNTNNRSGWLGAIVSSGNTYWKFCRVDGLTLQPLVADYLNYQQEYAVLQLGSACPPDSVPFARGFDSEDGSTANLTIGDVSPNSASGNVTMYFCMFRYSTPGVTAPMAQFPDYGFSYGVFAPYDFTRGIALGWVYTDDEDSNTANWYSSAFYGESTRIVSDGGNTNIWLAQVR
jgi:hypothetical protein